MYLTFDSETTGLPKNFKAPISDSENWPRLVQLAWQINDEEGQLINKNDALITIESDKSSVEIPSNLNGKTVAVITP